MVDCKLNRGDSLSDDILLNILSKLTIKEQARTSILSSRWTRLWTLSSCLNIVAEDIIQREADPRIKTLKFIDTVDRIMTVHRGQAIDQLKIIFPDDPCVVSGDNLKVDSWIKIAKQKQVKVFYLDCKLKHSGSFRIEKFPLVWTTFSSLITLRLENIFLSYNFIHDILSNSPSLLELSIISCSRVFPRLNISGPFLKLKHLEIMGSCIVRLDISAPNLVTFNFTTCAIITRLSRICFKKVPLLTQLSCSLSSILQAWRDFHVLLTQLVTLTLTLTLSKNSEVGDIGNFPMLVNLKQMHIRFLSDDDTVGLRFWLVELFRASPYLCRLSFDLGTHTPKHNFIKNFPDHEFLEQLEIYNFKGFKYESRLLICIAESCSSLQKIIIHPNSSKRKVERECVESLFEKLTAHRELEIVFKAVNTNSF